MSEARARAAVIPTRTRTGMQERTGRMRAKKDGEFVNVKIEQALADKLNQYVAATGYSKTAVVEKALRMFLEGNVRQEGGTGND